MEPLYVALSFVAILISVVSLGRYVVGRTAAKRSQRHLMDSLEPIRLVDEKLATEIEQTYKIAVTTETRIYEVTGPVEAVELRYETVAGHLFHIGYVEIAPESVDALEREGIHLEKFLAGGESAHDRVETASVRADRLRGAAPLVDRYAGGGASLRHIEFCFEEGDDPRRSACYVLSFDGRRIV